MDTFRIIGSFDKEQLERWILEQKRKLSSPWKIAGHAFIIFQKDNPPYIYKSLANIHVDSVKDLLTKFPDSFILCIVSEVFISYSRPKTVEKIFPTNELNGNVELRNIHINNDDEGWRFSITGNIMTNGYSFSTERIFLSENDVYQIDDTIRLDFVNKKIISKLIDYDHAA
jgi:hypothetical protein